MDVAARIGYLGWKAAQVSRIRVLQKAVRDSTSACFALSITSITLSSRSIDHRSTLVFFSPSCRAVNVMQQALRDLMLTRFIFAKRRPREGWLYPRAEIGLAAQM